MSTQPKERPIILKAHEVRGVLDGTLTHLRRTVTPQPVFEDEDLIVDDHWLGLSFSGLLQPRRGDMWMHCSYGKPGERLWVKEKWSDCSGTSKPLSNALYEATYWGPSGTSWRSSIHMPRWASRITLELTDVRVERNAESGAWEWLLAVWRCA